MVEFTAMGQPDSHFKKKLLSMDGKIPVKTFTYLVSRLAIYGKISIVTAI